MKFLSLLLILLGTTVVLPAQKQLVVTGTISGMPEHSVVSLTDASTPTDTIAKGVAKNGVFELKGSLRQPTLLSLNLHEVKKRTIVFLDNNKVTITGKLNELQKMEVSGSPTQNDFKAFQDQFNPLFEKYTQVSQQMKAGGNTDSLQVEAAHAFTAIQEKVESYLQAHPASAVSPFLILVTAQLSDDINLLEKRFNMLDATAKQSYYGNFLHQMIDDGKIGAIGSDAIEFTQADVNGKPVSLSSFKGKYVLIDFWASWCGPCRAENPNVVTTYNQFKEKNFTILGVSLDKAKEPWIKAISDDNLPWTHVSDLKFWNNEVAVKYHIQSIPQNFLVDPNGKIIAKNLRGQALREKLCEVLGCN